MKIAIITVCKIKDFPPIETMLCALDGSDITVIAHARDADSYQFKSIDKIYAYDKSVYDTTFYKKLPKGESIAFHLDKLQKYFGIRKAVYKSRKVIKAADIVWVLHEDTFLSGGKWLINFLGSYLYTMYELPFRYQNNKKIYLNAANKASILITPDFFRAHIMKAIFALKELPYVVPNKPLNHPQNRNLKISEKSKESVLNSIIDSGRKIIMYMGIISGERPLNNIIEAVKLIRNEYEFVVVGQRTNYLDEIMNKFPSDFTYLGYAKPPEHLAIASYAHIAYISYVANNGSINAVFCAPNKLFEFAGFGIPMLCNDNPGLKYQVELNNMGVCLSSFSPEKVVDAIKEIDSKYELMSDNAKRYFQSVDIKQAFEDILNKKEQMHN